MGLFSSDGKTRAQRRADAKALKRKARLEAKAQHSEQRKAQKKHLKDEHKFRKKDLKAERKNVKRAAKAQTKAAKAESKTIAAKQKAAEKSRKVTPANIKRYLTVARLVSPVVAPLAYRGAIAAREQLNQFKATRAGVAPELLARYSGHGAPLAARIESARAALKQVPGKDASADTGAFVDAINTRLDNLAIAVDAAETMPPAQRRSAHASIDSELGAIDADILARLGVRA